MNAPARISESRLATIVGADNITFEPETIAQYQVDGTTPCCAVRPRSAEEVAELLRLAATENLAVIATGARTKIGLGLPPARYDVAIDMSRLDQIVAYDPGDLTLSVEAGVSLRALETVLAEQNQFLPLAAPYFDRATIGGTISAGVDSPLRQFFGTPRDYVLGMEFVTGQGVKTKSGGRVVKNVTGYDLHKLMIGALGSLGIITKINFRTFPLPAEMRGVVAKFETVEGAMEFCRKISRSPLSPFSLDVLSPGCDSLLSGEAARRCVSSTLPVNLLTENNWTVITSFGGSERVLSRHESDIRQMADGAGASGAEVLSADLPALMSRVQEFIPIVLEASPAATVMKLSVLPTLLAKILNRCGREAENVGLSCVALARACGIVYMALLPASDEENARRNVLTATEGIIRACAELGGNASIRYCPTKWKTSLAVWGPERPDFDQMRKLKNVFDPRHILAPGRYVGGL